MRTGELLDRTLHRIGSAIRAPGGRAAGATRDWWKRSIDSRETAYCGREKGVMEAIYSRRGWA